MQRPWSLHALGHAIRSHAMPENAEPHLHAPDFRSQTPAFEHSAIVCAVFVADGTLAHASPAAQRRSEQS
jgi:hypothetical protein